MQAIGSGFGIPYGMLALVIIVVPVVLAVFLGAFSFRRLTPFVFRCRRCDLLFRRAARRGFPRSCPRCGSR